MTGRALEMRCEMRIVNLKTFLAMPAGTLFAKFEPHVFGDLCIKEDSIGLRDFGYQNLADAVKAKDSGEYGDLLDESIEGGIELAMDFECAGRDGCFVDDQLFAVYSVADVAALIGRLQVALDSVMTTDTPPQSPPARPRISR